MGQTYVAVEPDGRDPCDLRLAEGDAAVRELIARRVPLYRFVLSNVVARFDLDRADSRVDAVREAAHLVASIRDRSKVDAFSRELAGMVGVEVEEVRAEVRRAAARPARSARPASPVGGQRPSGRVVAAEGGAQGGAEGTAQGRAQRGADEVKASDGEGGQATRETSEAAGNSGRVDIPDPRDRRFSIERDVLKLALQNSAEMADAWPALDADDFTHPWYQEIFERIQAGGGPDNATTDGLLATTTEQLRRTVSALSVERLHVTGEPDAQVAAAYVVRLRELAALRRIQQVKSRLQRMNPVTQAGDYNRMFGELVALEAHRRALRERAIGSSI
ncbi:MAG: hypothetical protein WKF73_05985 [Nocardioidaceae bacterium]